MERSVKITGSAPEKAPSIKGRSLSYTEFWLIKLVKGTGVCLLQATGK